MAKLQYTVICSLDGFIADETGNFDWAMPDEEVHTFVNELERPVGTYLYGRRMYGVMKFWEGVPSSQDQPRFILEYAALWKSAEKVVYSRTLDAVSTARTRIERSFDPAAIERMKTELSQDISIGGPELASHALEAGLVDRIGLIVTPIVIGGGTKVLPERQRIRLALETERRFSNGMVYLAYAVLPQD